MNVVALTKRKAAKNLEFPFLTKKGGKYWHSETAEIRVGARALRQPHVSFLVLLPIRRNQIQRKWRSTLWWWWLDNCDVCCITKVHDSSLAYGSTARIFLRTLERCFLNHTFPFRRVSLAGKWPKICAITLEVHGVARACWGVGEHLLRLWMTSASASINPWIRCLFHITPSRRTEDPHQFSPLFSRNLHKTDARKNGRRVRRFRFC